MKMCRISRAFICAFRQITNVKRPQTGLLPWSAGGWLNGLSMGRTFHIMFASISLVTMQRLSAIVRTTPLTSLPSGHPKRNDRMFPAWVCAVHEPDLWGSRMHTREVSNQKS
ncbi:hypothetical protein NKT34_06235 [Paenibacillus polysaccharolyticus]|uniref:hypothetical protein n=1 Tax=Paenibacillus polysaccharolyticus TaxID=582692 RepID=UPI0012B8DC82|nr:hypothetical protein [Paenibacillus polysaccharolyticus]MCP1132879.1 hypothetical protein [Paenibacillus polysaccharolyticus]